MTIGDIEERLAELDEAVAELKATATQGSDVSLALSEHQRELESEQEKLRVVLRRVGEHS